MCSGRSQRNPWSIAGTTPGLEHDRADVIVGGLCVLVSIMRNFGFDECLVSESDILDGLIRSQLPTSSERVGD